MGTTEGCPPALPCDPTATIGILIYVPIIIIDSAVVMAFMLVFIEAIWAEVGRVSCDLASLATVEVYVRLTLPCWYLVI